MDYDLGCFDLETRGNRTAGNYKTVIKHYEMTSEKFGQYRSYESYRQVNKFIARNGIDCAALDYVSSAGLRAVLLVARAAQRAHVPFALCGLQPAVREVFDLSGFSRIIVVAPDRATALAQTQQGRP